MSARPRDGEIHVVAGVILGDHDQILLAQRPATKDLSGYWEFPGGKVEPGETRFQALARELKEELGIGVTSARPLTRLRHAYPHKTVLLDFWIVRHFAGIPTGLDGQNLQWSAKTDLDSVALLPADQPMLRLLSLPDDIAAPEGAGYEIASTQADRVPGRLYGALCRGLADATHAESAGSDFIVLRDMLPDGELCELCWRLEVPVFAKLDSLARAWELGASGTHHLAG